MSIAFTLLVAIAMMGAFSRFAMSMVSVLAEPPKVDELVESALSEPDYYNCEVSTERMFEMRLVEAEIMGLEDMTMCEDVVCKNCQPSRDRIRAIHRAKQRAETEEMKALMTREERYQNLLEAQERQMIASASVSHENMTPRRYPRPPAGNGGGSPSGDALRDKKFRELASKQSAQARNSTAVVNGRIIPRPNNVPKRADVFMQAADYGQLFLIWTWTDDGSPHGRPMVIRQEISNEVFASFPMQPVAKAYAEGAIKELETYPPCDGLKIEVDQLLDSPVAFSCDCGDCF